MIQDNPNLYEVTSDTKFLLSPFQYPDNIATPSELIDYELGGIALQDPSKGLTYQVWKGYWQDTDSTVYLESEDIATPIALFTQANVIEFAFTFDQNMRWSTAIRLTGDTLEHRWYDTAAEAYVISTYSGVTSARLAVDDKRDTQVQFGASDMILTYVRSNQVRWRIQRDRFLTEYSYPTLVVSDSNRITHFGMSKTNRLQWRIGQRRIKT